MRIAISNLAWDVLDDKAVASLLNTYGIDAIDIAPGKYFPNFKNTSTLEIDLLRKWWADQGIAITGMQALLFGTKGLNMFGAADIQAAMLDHFDDICRIGGHLGARKIVFGSPKNRDRTSLSDEQTQNIAVNFFRRLGDIASRYGVVICLEPNPSCYGANFMINSIETANMVIDVVHPAIRMQLDTGAITLNKEDVCQVINEYRDLIGHIHVSEPDLVCLGYGNADHSLIATALKKWMPQQLVTIEMLPAKHEPNLIAIERALRVASYHYRHKGMRSSV